MTPLASELALIVPNELVFLNTVIAALFAVTMSNFPSPSISATPKLLETLFAKKSTLGAKEVPALMEPAVVVFLKTESVVVPPTIISGFPSPSISQAAIATAEDGTAKSTFARKDIVPGLLTLRSMLTLVPKLFAVAISSLPSPSMSATTIPIGRLPVVSVTAAAKEEELTIPTLLMLRYIATLLEL